MPAMRERTPLLLDFEVLQSDNERGYGLESGREESNDGRREFLFIWRCASFWWGGTTQLVLLSSWTRGLE